VTYTRCRIDTTDSSDDEDLSARNMWRIKINIYEKELCVKSVIYKKSTEMNGQYNYGLILFSTKRCLCIVGI